MVAWGYNNSGQTTVPPGLSNVVAIAAGGYHSLALQADGTVVAWGYNGYGQTNVPPGLSNVVAIAARRESQSGDYSGAHHFVSAATDDLTRLGREHQFERHGMVWQAPSPASGRSMALPIAGATKPTLSSPTSTSTKAGVYSVVVYEPIRYCDRSQRAPPYQQSQSSWWMGLTWAAAAVTRVIQLRSP